jgi:hypothetical protein
MASAPELDAAILASTNPRWTKVAMVLSRAAKASGLVFAEDEDEFEILEERLAQLVASGQLLAQGDIREWRFSEVRLSDAQAQGREP